jgi:hypothetical protein
MMREVVHYQDSAMLALDIEAAADGTERCERFLQRFDGDASALPHYDRG